MFEVVLTGAADIESRLDMAAEYFADTRRLVQSALEILAEGVAQTLDEAPYPDILPSSRDARKYNRYSPPLIDGGGLQAAATAVEPDVDGSTYNLSADGSVGTIGVDDLFHGARRHFFGYGGPDSRGRSFDEPARAFLVIRPGDVEAVIEVTDVWARVGLGA